MFAIIPEYDDNSIFLNTFISYITTVLSMSSDNHKDLIVLHVKNKLRGHAAELVYSRNSIPVWDNIQSSLESHFGDSKDLSALIEDLQKNEA